MRVEFIKSWRYSLTGITVTTSDAGAIAELPDDLAKAAIDGGYAKACSPVEARETKPAAVVAEAKADDEAPKKRRGRPPGSKNKPKVDDE